MKQQRNPDSIHPPLAGYSHQIELRVEDLVKLTFYLTEPVDAARRRAILSERLGGHTPCMTVIQVAGLATPSIKVEVRAWASAGHERVRAGRTG